MYDRRGAGHHAIDEARVAEVAHRNLLVRHRLAGIADVRTAQTARAPCQVWAQVLTEGTGGAGE
jgi:hypothetical protein